MADPERVRINLKIMGGFVEGWAFQVPSNYLPKLDILMETIEDRDATKALRFQKLRELGFPGLEALKRDVPNLAEQNAILQQVVKLRATNRIWTEGKPPRYAFEDGDIFVATDRQSCLCLDVVRGIPKIGIRVYRGKSTNTKPIHAFKCQPAEVTTIIKTGISAFNPGPVVWEPVSPPPRKKAGRRDKDFQIETVQFSYMDADGFPSERRVRVHSVDGDLLTGFCLLRQAERTFRLDRIQGKIVRESTGEMIRPIKAWKIGTSL